MDKRLIEALVEMGELDPKYLDERAVRGEHRFRWPPQGGDGYGHCVDCGAIAQCKKCGRPGQYVNRLWCECSNPDYVTGPCSANGRL